MGTGCLRAGGIAVPGNIPKISRWGAQGNGGTGSTDLMVGLEDL